MKKVLIGVSVLLLVLTGCIPNMDEEDEVVQKEDQQQMDPSILTKDQLSDENYRTILPYRSSEARGVILNQIANRVDIDEMEEGLRRLSKSYFDPDKYYFEEGQYLSEGDVEKLIDTLNPDKAPLKDEDASTKEKMTYHEENPRYVSHILEQNYLKKDEENSTVEVVGVSIGIALKSVYHFEEDGETDNVDLNRKAALKAGKKSAQIILEKLRDIDELQDVPIMFSLYEEADKSSPVPGSFQMTSYAEPPGRMPGDWDKVKEENVLFPSQRAKDQYFDDYQLMKRFGEGITEFFSNYVGYIGDGFYIDENLKQLSIEIPMEFYGRAEVIAFTQYIYGLVKETFSPQYKLEVEITSNDQTESVIYRNAGEEDLNVYITD